MIMYFLFYNVIVLPVLIYFHLKGECTFIESYLANATLPICQYISNILINIVFAEILFVVIMLLVKAKLWASSTRRYPEFRPNPHPKKEHF